MSNLTSYEEIQAQIAQLMAQADAIKKSEIDAVLAEIKSKIETYGLTAEQLGFSTSGKKAGKRATSTKEPVIKYRNAEGLVWSGAARGRKPNWVSTAQKNGEDMEKYRVN